MDKVDKALRAANIPEDGWEIKGSGLAEAEMELYRSILRALPETGGPPATEWLRAEAAAPGLDPDAALQALAARDLIVLDMATREIVGAYPFSGVPTAHRVSIDSARPVYAMCAVDALGIPSMLGRDATVVSTDTRTGEAVRVEVRDSAVYCEPPGAVVLICEPGDRKGPECCATISFFSSMESADAYRREHPDIEGQVLTAPEAVEAGRRVFGSAMSGRDSPVRCGEQSCHQARREEAYEG